MTIVAPIVIRPPGGSEGHPMIDPASASTTSAGSPAGRRLRRLAAVAVVAAALALAACSSGGSSTATTATTGGSSASTASGGPSQGATTITIKNFMFSPMDVTVSPGATVTVVNKDSVAHTVTGSSGGFNTGDVQPGQSKTFTAPDKPGTYPYICSIHQYMTGTLTVS
jgi:plastocyanin